MTEDRNTPTGPTGPAPEPPVTSSPTATAPPPAAPPPSPPAPGGAPEPPEGVDPRSAMTPGIILIMIGVALLAAQSIPGLSLWAMWPLFIIVPGLAQMFLPGKRGWSIQQFFDGLVTVAIGVILLGNSTGYLSWSVWWEILRLWPVLLISAGLGILGRATHQGWVRALGTVVVLLAFAYAVAVSLSGTNVRFMGSPSGAPFSFTRPMGTSENASLTLKSGVGEIFVDGTVARRVAVEGVTPFGPPSFTTESAGGSTDVVFELTKQDSFTMYPGAPSARVEALLSESATWDVVLETGVASLDADLSDVPVDTLELSTGVSSNLVRLGDPPDGTSEGRVTVKAGVASVRILVPSDAEVRVESDSGLIGHDIDDSFTSLGGGRWETPGFSAAQQSGQPVWIISANSGVGSFAVATY